MKIYKKIISNEMFDMIAPKLLVQFERGDKSREFSLFVNFIMESFYDEVYEQEDFYVSSVEFSLEESENSVAEVSFHYGMNLLRPTIKSLNSDFTAEIEHFGKCSILMVGREEILLPRIEVKFPE